MSTLESKLRDALEADDPGADESLGAELASFFMRRSRLATGFAFMKMMGLIIFAVAAGVAFFLVDSTQAQIACATACLIGFNGFGIWWLWYWMFVERNATLREIKRVELQLAELRAAGGAHASSS